MTARRRWPTALATGACVVALGGCAGAQDDAARAAAQRLLAAAAEGDGPAACEVLAPATRSELEQTSGKPCEEAVLDEDLADGDGQATVTVFDSMAQVVQGSQTVFVSRFDDAWLVVAAACTPEPSRPYDCSIGLP